MLVDRSGRNLSQRRSLTDFITNIKMAEGRIIEIPSGSSPERRFSRPLAHQAPVPSKLVKCRMHNCVHNQDNNYTSSQSWDEFLRQMGRDVTRLYPHDHTHSDAYNNNCYQSYNFLSNFGCQDGTLPYGPTISTLCVCQIPPPGNKLVGAFHSTRLF
jgi:hypothetical protein